MMDQMKEMMALQKKAQAVQDKLENIHIEADEAEWTVTVNGKQDIIAATKDGQPQTSLLKALNKALTKSREIAANEMKDVMGSLGIPGMGGTGPKN